MPDEVDGREKWQIDRELVGGKIVRPVRSFCLERLMLFSSCTIIWR